MNMKILGPGGS